MSAGGRIAQRFAALRRAGRSGLVSFVTAGDPDYESSLALIERLPSAGADLIELGIPFSDPMADGPAIQASSLRALRSGQTLQRTLDMVAAFRQGDTETPVILMGYFNPIYAFGIDRFTHAANAAGVDGLIVVDLPPEECDELLDPARANGLDMIFLATPTTDEARLPAVLANAAGFLYYVAITGITGTVSASVDDVEMAVRKVRRMTNLPIAVGFGIKTADQARAMARVGDAAVVGSALVNKIAENLDDNGKPRPGLADSVASFVGYLATGVRGADEGAEGAAR